MIWYDMFGFDNNVRVQRILSTDAHELYSSSRFFHFHLFPFFPSLLFPSLFISSLLYPIGAHFSSIVSLSFSPPYCLIFLSIRLSYLLILGIFCLPNLNMIHSSYIYLQDKKIIWTIIKMMRMMRIGQYTGSNNNDSDSHNKN